MSIGRSLLISAGFASAFALGVWARPHIDTIDMDRVVAQKNAADAPSKPAVRSEADRAEARRIAATTPHARIERADITPLSTELHDKLQPLLNRGTKMTIAADGFKNAEQFAAVAHASRNLEIPFMVLKDRVVTQQKSLVTAIRELKPDANALREAERARAEAKEDVAEIGQ